MGVYIIKEPGFQGTAGPWRGTGAAPLWGAQGGEAPRKLRDFRHLKGPTSLFFNREFLKILNNLF